MSSLGLGRRQFLKLGFWGTVALGGVSTTALLTGCSSAPVAQGYRLLRAGDVALLTALLPVVLKGALPEGEARQAAVTETLHSLDSLAFHSSVEAHKQVRQLFDLLTFAPSRWLVAGVHSDWPDASEADVEKFLLGWRSSRVGLLRGAYAALVQMIEMSWYLLPQSWPAIAYVPPRKVVEGAV